MIETAAVSSSVKSSSGGVSARLSRDNLAMHNDGKKEEPGEEENNENSVAVSNHKMSATTTHATAATKSITSHSTAASSYRRSNDRAASPSIIPRNPRDTASQRESPGRRSGKQYSYLRGSKHSSRTDHSLDGQSLNSHQSSIQSSVHNANQPPQPPHFHSNSNSSSADIRDMRDVGQETSPAIHGDAQIVIRTDPDEQEQAMFEQRLCEDEFGVAVRKINQNGKSVLRYVRCVPLFPQHSLHSDADTHNNSRMSKSVGAPEDLQNMMVTSSNSHSAASKSVSSLMGRISRRGLVSSAEKRIRNRSRSRERHKQSANASIGSSIAGSQATNNNQDPTTKEGSYQTSDLDNDMIQLSATTNSASHKSQRALTWGKKNEVRIPLTRFTAVRKGKTTDRTRRNPCPHSRLLSLVTDDRNHSSLDIEAPTKLDRDKFARAFARFLNVPLETDVDYHKSSASSKTAGSVHSAATSAAASDAETSAASKTSRSVSSRIRSRISASHSAPGEISPTRSTRSNKSNRSSSTTGNTSTQTPNQPIQSNTHPNDKGLLPSMSPSTMNSQEDMKFAFELDDGSKLALPPMARDRLDTEETHEFPHDPQNPLSSQQMAMMLLQPNHKSQNNLDHALEAAADRKLLHKQSNASFTNSEFSAAARKRIEADNLAMEQHDALIFSSPPERERVHRSSSSRKSKKSKNSERRDKRDKRASKSAITSSAGGGTGPHIKLPTKDPDDDDTDVSSLTAGFDQEIVEELHQALTELRAELEASRAEAARAVKVAEQAIQSAESCTSNDWNSTVTHKAAEAAAQAQKRSAEAMARQRLAEERLANERRSASFWRRQAEAAEEEAGALQTRAAAAEVQRAAMAEELANERKRAREYTKQLKQNFEETEGTQRQLLDDAKDVKRTLEIELDGTKRELTMKSNEAKSLRSTLVEIQTNTSDTNKHHHHKSSTLKKFSRIGKKKKGGLSSPNHRSNGGNGAHGETALLSCMSESSPLRTPYEMRSTASDVSVNGGEDVEKLLQLHAETAKLRHEFEHLRRATSEEIQTLPQHAEEWANKAGKALVASQAEVTELREKLAKESAMRRKLLNEVQDLRGNIRVYCRPRPHRPDHDNGKNAIVSVPSNETLLLHRENVVGDADGQNKASATPLSFEFDRVFCPETPQNDVYSEMEELVLGALDGFNVCLMAYGQTGSGKTHTLIGEYSMLQGEDDGGTALSTVIGQHGIHFQAAQQLFTIADHRSGRYQDTFSMTIVEVHNEKLTDLVAGTDVADECGNLQGRTASSSSSSSVKKGKSSKISSRRGFPEDENENTFNSGLSQSGQSNVSKSSGKLKLEIRTNYDGDTIVQGLHAIPVKKFEDVLRVWDESLSQRASRLAEQGVEMEQYEATCHTIATIHVVSTNIATGVGTVGRIQFVDLAGSDLAPRKSGSSASKSSKNFASSDGILSGVGNSNEWKFTNKSLGTLHEVINARCQFMRSVPYRNSTLTHLLRDSLEADTKVLLMVCVSSDEKDLQETATALRFASRMRRVTVGKATKHTVSLA